MIGGTGFIDKLILDGDYSAGVVFTPKTMTGVESIFLTPGHTYNLTLNDANVHGGDDLGIDGSGIDGGDFIRINASAETKGSYTVLGSAGADILKMGGGDDAVFAGEGPDSVYAGAGADHIDLDESDIDPDVVYFIGDNAFNANDAVVGNGLDAIMVDGGYAHGLTLTPDMTGDVQFVGLTKGHSWDVDARAMLIPAHGFTIDARELAAGETAHIDARVAAGGDGVTLFGSRGDDQLLGGAGYDTLYGSDGKDVLNGGDGPDAFLYNKGTESTGAGYDTVVKFDTGEQTFATTFAGPGSSPEGFDGRVTQGALSQDHFNSDLAAAVGAHKLAADHAVLFRPDSGSLQGEWFLIVDANHKAGYQGAEHDLVVHLENPQHIGEFGLSNFGTAGARAISIHFFSGATE